MNMDCELQNISKMDFSTVKMLADSGANKAQFDLAQRYYNGNGVSEDEKMATHYMRLAADSGLVEAQYELASNYSETREEQNKYYIMAADNGHADSMIHAASAYMYGDGVGQDLEKAVQYYTKYLETSEDQECRGDAITGIFRILGVMAGWNVTLNIPGERKPTEFKWSKPNFDLEKFVAGLGVTLLNARPNLPEKKIGVVQTEKNDKVS